MWWGVCVWHSYPTIYSEENPSLVCRVPVTPLLVQLHNYLPPVSHEDRNKNYFSCLRITRLRTKWLWSSQLATLLVFKLYLSGQAANPSCCKHKNWTPGLRSLLGPNLDHPKCQSPSTQRKHFASESEFLAQVSQKNWDIYQRKCKTTKTVVCFHCFNPECLLWHTRYISCL